MGKKESAKDRILRVASELFYREGIRAVGIDRIIEESGVAKASFYRSFATKDELVVAYVEQRYRQSTDRMEAARAKFPDAPRMQLLEVFRGLAGQMSAAEFRGCPFMNTSVEFSDRSHPGHIAAKEKRLEIWRQIRNIAQSAGARDPDALAKQLEIVYSGAAMNAYIYRSPEDSVQFLNTVGLLIREHLGEAS